jgi:hypothetical protein
MFGDMSTEAEADPVYTKKIESPVYTLKGERPAAFTLYDESKTSRLVQKIEKSSVPEETKQFLRYAACRHVVFDYEQIAEFYASSDAETQGLMEDSALVIIDFDKAIEGGFFRLCRGIKRQFLEEHNVENNDA